uniref:protein PSK SIMULATOR 1-like n=1 Tax=Erigeron canadensis TaxID=72917 RepID=UPI001CB9AB82|nr:protein PSK SIMULATOR 1-like [Erigeron canadensis]
MVAIASIGCLYGNNGSFKGSPPNDEPQPANNHHLGILAFEAARTVSRLLNLYKSLSDLEISKLRKEVFKSTGVVYLNSDDEGYLLKLACAEKIEDLDKAALAVDRLGKKCSDLMLHNFAMIYADLKTGATDLRKYEYGSSNTKKKIRKLKRFLSSTLSLYGSMQTNSSGTEILEKKQNSPVPLMNMINFPAIEWKITPHKKHTCDIKKTNLWTQPFEKVVRLMARIVRVIYARICMVFGPYVPDLPAAYRSKNKQVVNILSEYWILEPRIDNRGSGPRLIRSKSKKKFVKFYSRKVKIPTSEAPVFHTAGPNTIGWSRLQILYANLIMMAEENMTRKKVRDDVRDEMYRMLPEHLKAMVKLKIRKMKECRVIDEKGKMKESLRKTFMWLSPMATNTLLWQRERRVEMTHSFEMRPPVLLLQTLHFADKEKTEAAIVEVLVGLSFLYMQENCQVPED